MTSRLHLRLLAGFWAASAAITLLGAWAIQNFTLVRPLYSGPFHPIPLFRMWTRWDCGWYQQIVTNGHVARGRIGVALQAVTPDIARAIGVPDTKGALIAQVDPGADRRHPDFDRAVRRSERRGIGDEAAGDGG